MADEEKKPIEKEVKKVVEEKTAKISPEKKEAKPVEKQDKKKVIKKTTPKEVKPELVREYVVPLRKSFTRVPEYKKAKKAVKYLKQFLAKHMKVEDRDLNKVKIDKYLNNEIWHRGIRKPLPRVKVIAEKKEGIVYVRLAEVPEIVKFKMARDEKKIKKVDKKAIEKVKKNEDKEKEIKEGRADHDNKAEEKELEKSGTEFNESVQKASAKTQKHTKTDKPKKVDVGVTQRKSLKK